MCVVEARVLQDQQARSRSRLEAGFQAVHLRSGVCGGVVVLWLDGSIQPGASRGAGEELEFIINYDIKYRMGSPRRMRKRSSGWRAELFSATWRDDEGQRHRV